MKEFLKKAIEIMESKKIDFGDIRIIDERYQNINVKNFDITDLKDDTTLGFGVRILANGGWGFASSNSMNIKELEKTVLLALDIAKASARLRNSKVKLAYEPSYKDVWKTPVLIDPFDVSIDNKIGLLLKINETLLKNKKVKIANSKMTFVKTHKYYASTEGSDIEQIFYYSGAGYS
ncbi:MAG: hypothetical protein N2Z60_07635, partial [Elusimicrobiales bacterium]|nr:hypothetical protein [Elusimicrobiales bacterium]